MTMLVDGLGVSSGIVLGRIRDLRTPLAIAAERRIPPFGVRAEANRYLQALKEADRELYQVRNQLGKAVRRQAAPFIDLHRALLQDVSLKKPVLEQIRTLKCNAEWALQQQRQALLATFEQIDDPYLRTRGRDVDLVIQRLQRILAQQLVHSPQRPGRSPVIALADDICPAEAASLADMGFAALITESGSAQSHTAILVRSFGIPAVLGVIGAHRILRDGERAMVDGDAGHVLVSADRRLISSLRRRLTRHSDHQSALLTLVDEPPTTADGYAVELLANIELERDLAAARRARAQGVGLYRSEFLYLNRQTLPTEDELYDAYRHVLETMEDAPVTIRTLDLGADKTLLPASAPRPVQNNPAMGLRAIRLCLQEPRLFMPQLRALLRAGVHGRLQILLPMVSSVAQIVEVRALLEKASSELAARGVPFAEPPLGAMIEIPAAALIAEEIARHVDFISIGSNDLTQFALAVDRGDQQVDYLHEPLHTGVLKLILAIVEAAEGADIAVSLCGEMAAEPAYTPVLLGLGLTRLSMHPGAILEVKRVLRQTKIGPLRTLIPHQIRTGRSIDLRGPR